jgi:hypothetical protein
MSDQDGSEPAITMGRDHQQGGHILIAGARYIAAHSPTQREMLQTAEIVQRLHRGEDLHERVD